MLYFQLTVRHFLHTFCFASTLISHFNVKNEKVPLCNVSFRILSKYLLLRARGFSLSVGDILSWRKKTCTRTIWRTIKAVTSPMVRLKNKQKKSRNQLSTLSVIWPSSIHKESHLTVWSPGLTACLVRFHVLWEEPVDRQTEERTGSG